MEKSHESVATSSRLLTDIPCKVCSDHSSGKHYGIYACDGCAGFFKRSIRRCRSYDCKSRSQPGACAVDKTHRNQCRACRLRKCLQVGMNKDAVQHERGPRHSTMRRQLAVCLKEENSTASAAAAAVAASSHTQPLPPHLFAAAAAAAGTGLPGIFQGFGDVVPLGNVGFLLSPRAFIHQPMPKYPHEISQVSYTTDAPEATMEQAARVLFRVIKWARRVQALAGLPLSDQLLLLSERWTQLFILTAAEAQMVIQPSSLLRAAGIACDANPSTSTPDSTSSSSTVSEVRLLQETMLKFQSLRLDATEYTCLRGIVTFEPDLKTSDDGSTLGSLTDRAAISVLRDQAQLSLNKYVESAYPTQPLRFGRLLLLLPSLGAICSKTIEDVFFRTTIGNMPMQRLIANMYQAESASSNLAFF